MKKIYSIFVLVLVMLGLAACNTTTDDKPLPDVNFDEKIDIKVALQKVTYEQSTPYVSLNGQTYSKGDFLPIMQRIGEKLNVNWIDSKVATGNAAIWQEHFASDFANVDLTTGPASEMAKVGMEGKLIDFSKYLEQMPNYKAFLDANPSVKQSATAYDGGMYFMPSFDGYNELRVMQIARIDWIKDILDAPNTDQFDATQTAVPTNYVTVNKAGAEAYSVKVANTDGTTRTVDKQRETNIINLLRNAGTQSGKALADIFRNYIIETYGGSLAANGYEKWSDVFAGVDASYDMDELVGLMYVIQANPNYILRETEGKIEKIHFWFPRQQTAGSHNRSYVTSIEMFGLRWNTYIDENNQIKDSRGGTVAETEKFIDTTNKISQLYKDGLITPETFATNEVRQELITGNTKQFGFMIYDYNGSTSNDQLINEGKKADPTLEMGIILPPVNEWFEDEWFAFSSETRNLQSGATAIPKRIESDPQKLARIIYYLDQLYNFNELESFGTITVFGPKEWLTGETIEYNNDKVWLLKDEANQEMLSVANGHMSNYVTNYLGFSASGVYRTLGREYLSLGEQAKQGIEKLNTAVQAGAVRLPGVYNETDAAKASWYKLIPGFFPLAPLDINAIGQTTFRDIISDTNIRTLVENGFSGTNGSMSAQSYKDLIAAEFDVKFIQPYQRAYNRLIG